LHHWFIAGTPERNGVERFLSSSSSIVTKGESNEGFERSIARRLDGSSGLTILVDSPIVRLAAAIDDIGTLRRSQKTYGGHDVLPSIPGLHKNLTGYWKQCSANDGAAQSECRGG
jgi:hypothetical protein